MLPTPATTLPQHPCSACHAWGYRPYNTGDLSTNCAWLSLLAFGESWHNTHHCFPYSARHGLEWWEVDLSWYFIRTLQVGTASYAVVVMLVQHCPFLAIPETLCSPGSAPACLSAWASRAHSPHTSGGLHPLLLSLQLFAGRKKKEGKGRQACACGYAPAPVLTPPCPRAPCLPACAPVQFLGLAWDIRLPSESSKKKFSTSNPAAVTGMEEEEQLEGPSSAQQAQQGAGRKED